MKQLEFNFVKKIDKYLQPFDCFVQVINTLRDTSDILWWTPNLTATLKTQRSKIDETLRVAQRILNSLVE
jgi:hypothetical protein